MFNRRYPASRYRRIFDAVRLLNAQRIKVATLVAFFAGLVGCSYQKIDFESSVGHTTEMGTIITFLAQTSHQKPILLVLWRGNRDTGASDELDHSIVVNGRPVRPKDPPPGVYALQSDYSLKRLSISESEFHTLYYHFTLLTNDNLDALWGEKVLPYLEQLTPADSGKRQGSGELPRQPRS